MDMAKCESETDFMVSRQSMRLTMRLILWKQNKKQYPTKKPKNIKILLQLLRVA